MQHASRHPDGLLHCSYSRAHIPVQWCTTCNKHVRDTSHVCKGSSDSFMSITMIYKSHHQPRKHDWCSSTVCTDTGRWCCPCVCVIGSLNDTNRPRVWAILASSCPAIKRSCIIDNTHTHYIYNRQAHTQTVLLISVCVCVCATDGGGAVADQYVFSRSDCIIIILMTAVFPLADGLRDKQGNSGGL